MTRAVRWSGIAALGVTLLVAMWLLLEQDHEDHSSTPNADAATPGAAPLPDASSRPATVAASADPSSSDAAVGHPIADAGSAERDSAAGLTHVSGIAHNDLGRALVGHTVEVRDGDKLEGSATTTDDGSFRIDGLTPGAKVLSLLGPGQGDALAALIEWRGHICGTEPIQEERRLNLTLPGEGLDRTDLLVRGHGARLIVMRIVDDSGRPLEYTFFDFEGFPNDQSATDENGIMCRPIHVDQARTLRVTMNSRTREAPFPVEGYLPLEIRVEPQPEVQDLGTLVMARMAGLKLTLVDGKNGTGVGDADVRLHVTGGGQPPADVRGAMEPDGSYVLWSGRTTGDYELDVTAPGYRAARQVGVLVAGDAPVPLELTLEPLR
jgi:hypothetical protein